MSEPIVDVSKGTPSCLKAHVFCLGKADSDGGPFADDPQPAAGGCAAGGGQPAGALALLAGLLVVVTRRRRC